VIAFQLVCLIFLPIAYAVQVRNDYETLALAPLIFLSAWAGEASSIHLYGFYGYADGWWPRVGGVPLLVAAIWPMVILSGRDVIRALWPEAKGALPLLVGALVFIDAAMVEVVAVRCGLWSWTEPGYLGVPLIGVIGWALFGFAATLIIENTRGRQRWLLLLGAPALLHMLLVGSWWTLFRWVGRGDWFALFVAIILLATFVALRRRPYQMPLNVASVRMIAGGIFVGLLLFAEPTAGRLWLHVGLTSIPYALATRFKL